MFRAFRSCRPSPAMLVAVMALFVALGGTSYAVATGSIDSRELKNNTIRSKDIRTNAVRAAEVRRGAVRSSEVGDGSLSRRDLGFGIGDAGGNGNVDTGGLALAGGSSRSAVATHLVTREGGFSVALNGSVTVGNPADKSGLPATVTIRLRHNDHFEAGGYSQTIPDGGTATLAGAFVCDGIPAGRHDFTLHVSVRGGAVNLGSRGIDAVSFRPIVVPP